MLLVKKIILQHNQLVGKLYFIQINMILILLSLQHFQKVLTKRNISLNSDARRESDLWWNEIE